VEPFSTFVGASTPMCNVVLVFLSVSNEKYHGVRRHHRYGWLSFCAFRARMTRSERDVNRIMEPSQDGRKVGRVFALGMGILFAIIFVLHALTF